MCVVRLGHLVFCHNDNAGFPLSCSLRTARLRWFAHMALATKLGDSQMSNKRTVATFDPREPHAFHLKLRHKLVVKAHGGERGAYPFQNHQLQQLPSPRGWRTTC